MGHLLHLDGPGDVVVAVVEIDHVVGLELGLAGDEDLAGVVEVGFSWEGEVQKPPPSVDREL